ncbi:MAG: CarD family transcriptional regulator [Acidimicrobiia bacterium]
MATKKSPAKKTAAKKSLGAKKSAPKKAAARAAAPTKKAVAKKAPAPKKVAPVKKAARVKKAEPKKAAAGKKTPATKAPVKKTVAVKEAPTPKPPPEKRAPEPKAPPKKATSKYSVGDKVVHPQHGAATIQRKVKQSFGGVTQDYYVLDISTESLTVMIPVDRVDSVVRSVISKTASKNVLGSLKGEPQEAGANWSRWYKVLTEKMFSGDIFQVAEVVRDLSFAQQTKGISPALKRMLSKARMTLISELAFSLETDEEDATVRLDRALPKIENPLAPVV